MELKSSLYECKVVHRRLSPKENHFAYDLFTFCLDLDEIDSIAEKFFLFSRNKFNLFSFHDRDHLFSESGNLKENIISYAYKNGIEKKIDRVELVTHVRILGYTFNPVCFYYFYGENGENAGALVEVHNTFGEMKPFLIKKPELDSSYYLRDKKFFYVSPFFNLDTEFEFKLKSPGEKLHIVIDDYEDDKKVFLSSYTGKRTGLNLKNLLYFFIKYPLLTVKVILLIHIQAAILYFKKLPFLRKTDQSELQKGVYLGKNS